jgi:hypothetical protein
MAVVQKSRNLVIRYFENRLEYTINKLVMVVAVVVVVIIIIIIIIIILDKILRLSLDVCILSLKL